VEGWPGFPGGDRLDFELARRQMLACGDFIANRTRRWFLKRFDDAVISPSGPERQIGYLESKYDPLAQMAGGG
jgi:hypothetical protein